MDRPAAGGFLSLTAFQAEGCGIALTGDEHKVSVTGLAFCVIWHEKQFCGLARCAHFPPIRLRRTSPASGGRIKHRETLFINGSTVSTGYSAPACGGGKGTGFIGEPRDPRIQ